MSEYQPRDGLGLFAKYAFMPNFLGYCGGPVSAGVLEACAEPEALPELNGWARQFEGAYPYLALIAAANRFADPLDYRVVEAYWLGNELLAGVRLAPWYDSLRERFAPRLSPKALDLILGKVPEGAAPFHAFHVLELCRRTGALAESLDTLDQCRISWGRVLSVTDRDVEVAVQPLAFIQGRLSLAPEQARRVARKIQGRGFVEEARPGGWVSIHWNWACDRLTERQLSNLRRHTLRHLALANQTL